MYFNKLNSRKFNVPQGARSHNNGGFHLPRERASRHNLSHHRACLNQHDRGPFSGVRHPHLRSREYPPCEIRVFLINVHCDQAGNQGEEGCRRVCSTSPGITFPGALTPPSTLYFPAKARPNTNASYGTKPDRSCDIAGPLRYTRVFYVLLLPPSPSPVPGLFSFRISRFRSAPSSRCLSTRLSSNSIPTHKFYLQSPITIAKSWRSVVRTSFSNERCRIAVNYVSPHLLTPSHAFRYRRSRSKILSWDPLRDSHLRSSTGPAASISSMTQHLPYCFPGVGRAHANDQGSSDEICLTFYPIQGKVSRSDS